MLINMDAGNGKESDVTLIQSEAGNNRIPELFGINRMRREKTPTRPRRRGAINRARTRRAQRSKREGTTRACKSDKFVPMFRRASTELDETASERFLFTNGFKNRVQTKSKIKPNGRVRLDYPQN